MVQGLLAKVGSSVGSEGKRFTEPFSETSSPHHPRDKSEDKRCSVFPFYVEEFFEPRVQGLLAKAGSSVGSEGKRFTEPFSETSSPHHP